MKKLFLFLIATSAHAAPWIDLAPDHANLHYSAGESAQVVVRSIHEPSAAGWKIRVFAEPQGGAATEIPLTRGVGRWISPPLAAGDQTIQFRAKLQGPATNPIDREVELSQIVLRVEE